MKSYGLLWNILSNHMEYPVEYLMENPMEYPMEMTTHIPKATPADLELTWG